MLQQRLKELFEKYYGQTASAEETEELKRLLEITGDDDLLLLVDNAWKGLTQADATHEGSNVQALQHIFEKSATQVFADRSGNRRMFPFYRRQWLRYAAMLLLVAGAIGYFYLSPRSAQGKRNIASVPAAPVNEKVFPGGFKATLKLGDGSTVELTPHHRGLITRQGGTNIFLDSSDVSYQTENKTADVVFNTMSTPRGGQYRLKLSDGTQVWLNAASSITYPTVFTGSGREVSITGEVFFDVAKKSGKPFRVSVDTQTRIDVLGTSFNVNSYPDESSIRTTLIDGAVRVETNNRHKLMQPGQQLQVYRNGESQLVRNADIDQAIAWKTGTFNFQRMKLDAVMRQLSRWYDVEIVYPGGVPDIIFGGKVQNSLSLQAMLEGLQAMDVHFRIEGKKVIVTN
jgi:transmembrane sensor